MKLYSLILVLVVALSAAGVFAEDIPSRWADNSRASYLIADFMPIEGTLSWEVVDAARSIRCRNDSSFVALLNNLDPVNPNKAMVWEAIAILTEGAVALSAADIDTTGLTPEEWREQYPQRARYIMHSGHWWDYWNRLAQLARLAYSDPLLIEAIHPRVLELLVKMEAAFFPFLIVPEEYYFLKKWRDAYKQAQPRRGSE